MDLDYIDTDLGLLEETTSIVGVKRKLRRLSTVGQNQAELPSPPTPILRLTSNL